MRGSDSKTIGVQIVGQRPDLQMMEWQEDYGSSAVRELTKKTSTEAVQRPEIPLEELQPHPLKRNRVNKRERRAGPSNDIPPLNPEPTQGEIVNQVKAPYSLKGELSKRSILHSPPLPAYPEWAQLAAVELKLTVSLSIDEKGAPYEVFISKSSSDSQTDLKVLRYTEKLRFEPSLSKSKGEIDWFFKLTP